MQEASGPPAHGDRQRVGDGVRSDSVEGGLLFVDHEALLGMGVLEIPVDVDHAGRAHEDVAHRSREALAGSGVRRVRLGDQRLEHRRARRHLRDGDARAIASGDRGHGRADALGDVVALSRPVVLR